MSAAVDRTSNVAQEQSQDKHTIMNGIKKVFNRNSTSSVSDEELSNVGSPTTNDRKLSNASSSENGTSVDSHEPASPRKGAVADMTTNAKVAKDGKTSVTGNGRSEQVATMDGANRHTTGHSLPKNGNVDLTQGKVTQTVEHLAGITDKTHHTHNIEEVTRKRDLERHQHHIQVHHQPIVQETHADEKMHTKAHPITNISETHASTDKDAALLASVAHSHGHKEQNRNAAAQHQIVDQGEQLSESIHHHIHNVVVPLITENSHEHHRIRTTIPTHHVVHEAPIVHQATTLEPITKEAFLARGGSLNSTKKNVEQANLLHDGTCSRKVDGVAEKLAKEMNLGTNTTVNPAATSKAQAI